MHTALPRLQGAACISATCSGRRSSMLQGFGTSTWLCRQFVVSRSGVNNCIFFLKKVEWGLEGYIMARFLLHMPPVYHFHGNRNR